MAAAGSEWVDAHAVAQAVLSGHATPLQRALEVTPPADRPAFLAKHMHLAARSKHRHIVAYLLQAGADINCVILGRDATCPLSDAIRFSTPLTWVDFLLASGANPNGPPGTRAWGTPMYAAAASSRVDIIERLLAAGAEVNVSYQSRTPLEIACWRCKTDVHSLAALLDAGATIDPSLAFTLTQDSTTPVAAMELMLARGLKLTEPDRLLYAAARHSLAMLNLLRRHGLCFTPGSEHSINTLHFITEHAVGDYERVMREVADIIRTLVSMGLDPRQRLRLDQGHMIEPLHSVMNANAITALIECGADVDARDDEGNTPLHRACIDSLNDEVVRTLVAAGAELDARNDAGCTPRDLYRGNDWAGAMPQKEKIA